MVQTVGACAQRHRGVTQLGDDDVIAGALLRELRSAGSQVADATLVRGRDPGHEDAHRQSGQIGNELLATASNGPSARPMAIAINASVPQSAAKANPNPRLP